MPTLFQPTPLQRARLAELEFGAPRVELPLPIEARPRNEDWSVSVRVRLLDPRLQRAISAAANGWVVERFD